MKYHAFRILDCTLILLLLASCQPGQSKSPKENKVVCIFFDLSLSTQKASIRESYIKNFAEIIKHMNHGDAIVAGYITASSFAEIDFCINYQFPMVVPSTDNPLIKSAQQRRAVKLLQAERDSLNQAVSASLGERKDRIMHTEILSSLQIAERVFAMYERPRKILIIMSDMIEDSQKYDFAQERLTEERINEIILLEKEKHRLPDLKNTRVYVMGSMAADAERFHQIRDFWFSYFSACEAEIKTERYGAAMIAFPE